MRGPERIIDANANRAREALRVLEDTARFSLDDARISGALKSLRHDLAAALEALPRDALALAASRDAPGDVGAEITTAREGRRDGPREICLAACKRLQEALRSIEEHAKSLHAADWTAFERLRFRAYDAERTLLLRLASGRARQWRCCVLLTESLCARPWLDVARAALDAGADCLQLREKSLDAAELLRRAEALVALVRSSGDAAVIVNDRPDIALLSGADGVHLGQRDLPILAARRLAGARLLVGVSCAAPDQAAAARDQGADYVGLGAMFPTTTKAKDAIAGPALLRDALALSPAIPPHLAIGGVNPDNARDLARAGARGVAVSSCVCAAKNPDDIVRRILEALTS